MGGTRLPDESSRVNCFAAATVLPSNDVAFDDGGRL
jgi:hypothetical protein